MVFPHQLSTGKEPVNIVEGIESVKWYGRNQIIKNKPFIVFDVAHNEAGIKQFIEFFQRVTT